MKNVLYLREMGMNDNSISTDIKNHRVRVVKNIDILYKGEKFNMFFEFMQGKHWHFRTENKRTGAPLKKPVYTVDLMDGLYIDTEYERLGGYFGDGMPWYSSFRKSDLEKEFYNEHHAYTRKDILEVVNRYKIGEKFDAVCLVEETATAIIKKIGGWRELDILNNDPLFAIGDTWTEEHKIVRCYKRSDAGAVCEVDLVTKKITG